MAITAASVAIVRAGLENGSLKNESAVRQGIVLRFLSEAGFDIWDTKSVVPEETNSGGKRPDFIIRSGCSEFAIELKAASENIGARHFQQTLNYVGTLGIRHAILTNGRKWIFLDEGIRGKYDNRELFRLDIEQLSDDEFAQFISLALEREMWDEGAFIMRARRVKQLLNDRNAADDETLMYFKTYDPLDGATASARAVYNTTYQTWTVLAGSTALNRAKHFSSTGKGLSRRRRKYIAEGRIVLREDGLLEYLDDILYESQTASASDIAGTHRAGRLHSWKDKSGEPPGKIDDDNF